MGEPRPGDFPDAIYVKTAVVPLAANQVGKTGDYVLFINKTVGWEVIDGNTVNDNAPVNGIIGQLQQDVKSGSVAKTSRVSIFTLGSWFYARANGAMDSNDYCFLTNQSGVLGFSRETIPVTISNIEHVHTHHLTIDIATGHNVLIGDTVRLAGQTNNPSFVGRHLVIESDITRVTVYDRKASGDSAAPFGTYTIHGDAATSHAQLISKLGGEYEGVIEGDIGIFTMLSGANREGGEPFA